MKHRIHVDDANLGSVLHHTHERQEPAVARLDGGGHEFERLPLRHIDQQNNCVFETSIRRKVKFFQNPPPGPGGNSSAVDRIWKGDEIESFGDRLPFRHPHFSRNSSTILHFNFLIGPGR